jgi:D-cysteine desulfhydrase
LSGNKVRKLDFLMQEALDQGADHIITCGGLQSNHCRAAAYLAVQLGLQPVLVLRGTEPGIAHGNYFLNRLCAAEVQFVTPELYARADVYMQEYADRHEGRFYVIPEGGSNATGAWGYVRCFQEILQQMEDQNLRLDTIVVPTGSGGTHAGLLLGKLMTGSGIAIVSVNVCDSADFFRDKIDRIMRDFCNSFHFSLKWDKNDIHIVDGFVGEGYGIISEKEVRLIKRFAREEGIVLDPVYGAKAFLGMEAELRSGKLPGTHILYIHTGGIFGLFPQWERFLS